MYSTLYLIYRRLRPSVGIHLGFILMFAILTNNATLTLLLSAIAFFTLGLFGDLYNDYWDYKEDKRNKRKDKFIVAGLLTRKQVWHLSVITALLSIISLIFTNIYILALGIYYLFLLVAYSHPKIRLKGSLKGYFIIASVYLFLPLALSTVASIPMISLYLFTIFFFSQYMYILTQKDSTDTKDNKNIFLNSGYKTATITTSLFAVISSLTLFILSFFNPIFFIFWIFNVSSKILNIYRINKKIIIRSQRSKFILIEFLTPYFYIGGAVLV